MAGLVSRHREVAPLAGSEFVVSHAHASHAGVAGVMVLIGPAVYLAAQAVYFWVETGTGWWERARPGQV